MRERTEHALIKIHLSLHAHSGDVELMRITEDGIAEVKLTGASGGYPMAQVALRAGIEKVLKEEAPDIKKWKRYRQ